MNKKTVPLLILLSLSMVVFGQTAARGLEGSWQGTLDAGGKLRLVLTVTKSPDGAYSGKIDSLDQGASIPIEVIAVNGDSVRLELKTVEAVFEGKLNADRSELTGTFSQGGTSLPLSLKRGGEAIAEAQAERRALNLPEILRKDRVSRALSKYGNDMAA